MIKIFSLAEMNYISTPYIFPGNSINSLGATDYEKIFQLGSVYDDDGTQPYGMSIEKGSASRAGIYLEFSETIIIYYVLSIV